GAGADPGGGGDGLGAADADRGHGAAPGAADSPSAVPIRHGPPRARPGRVAPTARRAAARRRSHGDVPERGVRPGAAARCPLLSPLRHAAEAGGAGAGVIARKGKGAMGLSARVPYNRDGEPEAKAMSQVVTAFSWAGWI